MASHVDINPTHKKLIRFDCEQIGLERNRSFNVGVLKKYSLIANIKI